MATLSSQLSDLDGPTVWRLVVLAIVVVGTVIAYVRTGSIANALVLGLLGAFAVAVAVAAVMSAVHAARARLGDSRSDG